MAVYFITGKLGAGKTLLTVSKIKEYLAQGRKVATNLDINLDEMFSSESKSTLTRLPDKPRGSDLVDLGFGYGDDDSDYDESKFGLIVLDEVGVWLNSRDWKDPDRRSLLDYFRHARKYRFDLFLIVQDIESVDKQIRKTICEHLVICLRSDRLKIPYLGTALRYVGLNGNFKKEHIAHVLYGDSPEGELVDTWKYIATDLYGCYSTGQIFLDDILIKDDGEIIDMRASYTFLSSYYLHKIPLIDFYKDKLSSINQQIIAIDPDKSIGDLDMARKHKSIDTTIPFHFKAVGLLLVLGVFFFFKNPFDNDLLGGGGSVDLSSPLPIAQSIQPVAYSLPIVNPNILKTPTLNPQTAFNAFQDNRAVVQPVFSEPEPDFISDLFDEFDYRLAGHGLNGLSKFVIVNFYDSGDHIETLNYKDFHRNGYSVLSYGQKVYVAKGSRRYLVTSKRITMKSGVIQANF